MRSGLLPWRSETVTLPINNPDQTLHTVPLLRGENGRPAGEGHSPLQGRGDQSPGYRACSWVQLRASQLEGRRPQPLRPGPLGLGQTAGLQPEAADTKRESATAEPWIARQYRAAHAPRPATQAPRGPSSPARPSRPPGSPRLRAAAPEAEGGRTGGDAFWRFSASRPGPGRPAPLCSAPSPPQWV